MEKAAESGLSWEEFCEMTWAEYEWHSIGYERRIERQLDAVRHQIAAMYNSSGFAKKKTNARDIMRLPLLDRPGQIRRIPKRKVEQLLRSYGT